MRPVIFYVDDQAPNLFLFKGACKKEWDVFTFEDPRSAIAELQDKKPWVILSDQKMLLMRGYEFLEICKEQYPLAERILVTGFSDEFMILNSIRRAHITDLIRKPWKEEELLERLEAAIARHLSRQKDGQNAR
jgi:response regulator RpfG family c-di-GMP phosphodiesterase